MKTDKKPVIGLFCVILSCVLVIGITLGLLSSANNNEVAAGSTADTTNTTSDNTAGITEEPPTEEPEPELQWNYKFKYFDGCIGGGGCEGDIAYKSQKNNFNLDDVTLTVSYGALWSGLGPNQYYDVPEFDFYFADPSGYINESIYTLKTIKEQFFSEKFDVTMVDDKMDSRYYYYEYAHTEEITIPKELFTESEGIIRMVIAGINVAERWHSYFLDNFLVLGEAKIKYQLQGEELILSKPVTDSIWHY